MTVDLSNCAREPIHVPGAIQPHGVLLALSEDARDVLVASANAGRLLRNEDALEGGVADAGAQDGARPDARGRLADLIGTDAAARVAAALEQGQLRGVNPLRIEVPSAGEWDGILHRSPAGPILELEPASGGDPRSVGDLYGRVRQALERIQGAASLDELHAALAEEVHALTGMDRVMVYRFDPDWNGEVVAEVVPPDMDAYLGHRFPASDIPAQARELYRRNWLRLIADVDYTPSPLEPAEHPATGEPLDLSGSTLRSVSPVHLEYLRNMEVAASMSVSLLRGGDLWGLVACHHSTPLHVPYAARTACEFLGQTFSTQLGAIVEEGEREYALRLARVQAELVDRVAGRADWAPALAEGEPPLEQVAGASGAALLFRGEVHRSGDAPSEATVRAIGQWLEGQGVGRFATDALSYHMPRTGLAGDAPAGVLATALRPEGGDFLLWFRPERVRTVRWAGDPDKPAEAAPAEGDGNGGRHTPRLHPRRSFQTYTQVVRGRAEPWTAAEAEAAGALRSRVVEMVLRQAEETARLNERLRLSNEELEAFAWIAGHDLKEPLRGMRTYARVLEADAELDEEHLDHARALRRLGDRMESMLESLLDYSRAQNLELHREEVDLQALLDDVLDSLAMRIRERNAEVVVPEPLPTVRCDPVRVGSVLQNLISNAIKYNDRERPRVEVTRSPADEGPTLTVADDGIGIPEKQWPAIFQLFRRLHPQTRYGGGAGAGLTIAQRLVQRHGGRLWLDSEPGRGTRFHFTLGSSPE